MESHIFQVWEDVNAVKSAKADLAILPRIYVQGKNFIINCFAYLERINEPILLFVGWIDAVAIHPEFHTNAELPQIFKYIEKTRLVHPTTKSMGIPSQNL